MKRITIFVTLLTPLAVPGLCKAQNQSSWINSVFDKGVGITCDLPDSEQIKNIGSKVDGAGMCVMSSIEMAARYQNLEELRGLRNWAAQFSGGAWAQRVDKQLEQYFKEKKIKPIPYLQYEGKEPEALMALIDKTNRMACITYGYSPRYGGSISHMVCCVMYGRDTNQYAVVLDNNYPGDSKYEWMPKSELVRRMRATGGSAWVFVWLTVGSPPSPRMKIK